SVLGHVLLMALQPAVSDEAAAVGQAEVVELLEHLPGIDPSAWLGVEVLDQVIRSAVLPAGPLGQLRADVHGEGVAQVVLAIGRGDVALVAERDPSGPGFGPEQPVARGSRGAAGDAGPVAGRRAIAATTPQQQQ